MRELTEDEFRERFEAHSYTPGAGPEAGWGTLATSAGRRALGYLADVGAHVTGSEGLADRRRELERASGYGAARAYEDLDIPQSFRDVDGPGAAARFTGGLLVGSWPELATAAAVGLGTAGTGTAAMLGTAGRLGVGALAQYPLAVGDLLSNQRKQAGYTRGGVAAALGAPYAGVTAVSGGLAGTLARGGGVRAGLTALDNLQGVRGAAARTGVSGLRTGAGESAEETFQEVMNQAARMAVDPQAGLLDPDAKERYLESAVGGFAMGQTTGPALGGWRRSAEYDLLRDPSDGAGPQAADPTPRTPPLRLGFSEDPLVSFPDGTVGRRSDVEAYVAQLPAEEQVAARARLMGYGPQEADPAPPLRLGFDPDVAERGTVVNYGDGVASVFGDGRVAMTPDAELRARYGLGEGGRPAQQTAPESSTPTNPEAHGIVQEAAQDVFDRLLAEVAAGRISETDLLEMAPHLAGENPRVGDVSRALDGFLAQRRREEAQADADAEALQQAIRAQGEQAQAEQMRRDVQVLRERAEAQDAARQQAQALEREEVEVDLPQVEAESPRTVRYRGREQERGAAETAVRRLLGLEGEPATANAQKMQRRALRRLGAEVDVDEDGQRTLIYPDNPMEVSEIARAELADEGVKNPNAKLLASRTRAVEKWLETNLGGQRASGFLQAPVDVEAVSAAEVGIGQAGGEGGAGPSGMREADTLAEAAGEALLEDSSTAEQRAHHDVASMILADPDILARLGSELDGLTAGQMRERIQRYYDQEGSRDAGQQSATLPPTESGEVRDRVPPAEARGVDAGGDQEVSHGPSGGDAGRAASPASEQRGAADAVTQARADVAAHMRGEFDRDTLMQRLADSPLTREQVGEVTQPMGERAPLAAELDLVEALRALPANHPRRMASRGQASDPADAPQTFKVGEQSFEVNTSFHDGDSEVAASRTTLEKLLDAQPALRAVVQRYRDSGLGHVVDRVKLWFVAPRADWEGAFFEGNGAPALALNAQILGDVRTAGLTLEHELGWAGLAMDHELGHALDETETGGEGVFSSDPRWGVRTDARGRLVAEPKATLMREVLAYYRKGGGRKNDSGLTDLLDYPLDLGPFDADGLMEARQEVFAQMWAAHRSEVGRAILEQRLPKVAAYMQEVENGLRRGPEAQAQGVQAVGARPAQAGVPQGRRTPGDIPDGGGDARGAAQAAAAAGHREPRAGAGREGRQGAVEGARNARFSLAPPTVSAAFKRWFGNSKVVDAEGKPLVVYHATTADFSVFDILKKVMNGRMDGDGFYFAVDAGHAEQYTGGSQGSNVMPVYLAISNPFTGTLSKRDLDVLMKWPRFAKAYEAEMAEIGKIEGYSGGYVPSIARLGVLDGNRNEFIKEALQRAGYDGLVIDADYRADTVYVAFEPTQIKSAIGNVGTYGQRPVTADEAARLGMTQDEANNAQSRGDIRFSRTARVHESQGRVREGFGKVAELAGDAGSKVLRTVAFTKDLAQRAKRVLPSAVAYVRATELLNTERIRAVQAIDDILGDFHRLKADERGKQGKVNSFLMASTRSGRWGYAPEWAPNMPVDEAMKARFEALSPEAQALVRRVFAHGNQSLQDMKAAVRGHVNSEFDAVIAELEQRGDEAGAQREKERKAKALQRFESLFKIGGGVPYAPLKRFGNHVVVGMSQAYVEAERNGDAAAMERMQADPAHYFVAFRETKREARRLASEIAPKFEGGHSASFERSTAQQELFGGRDMMASFSRLRKLVDESDNAAFKGEAGRTLGQAMTDLYLTMLAENSARVSEHGRRGVAGADEDMMRSFVTRGRAVGSFVANLKQGGAVTDALLEMHKETRQRTPGREERQGFFNEFLQRHVMGMSYQPSPTVDKVLAFGSVWMLISSPAHFFVNATQPWAMSLPAMMGKHHGRAAGQLFQAYTDVAPLVRDGRITQDEYDHLPADVRELVKRLADQGVIDISLEQELGNWRSDGRGTVDGAIHWAVGKMRKTAQTVEAVNRITTAITAIRLEKAQGATDEQALAYAERVINDTHGDYSGFNAPRFMRSNFGRLATQFRKFQLIQLSMFAKLFSRSFMDKSVSAEERAAARWGLTYNLAAMATLGGTVGMPGSMVVQAVLDAALGDEDDPRDADRKMRDMLGNGVLADLVTRGVPGALGVDLSRRIGAGDMLSLFPYSEWNVTSQSGYQAALLGAMGPVFGGVLPRAADGLGLIGQGQVHKGLEQLLPKGVADASRAMRELSQGVTNRQGVQLVEAEDMTWLNAGFQMFGLRSTETIKRSEEASGLYRARDHFNKRTASIKRDYIAAHAANDVAGMSEARAAWAALQEMRARNGFSKQPVSALLKAPRDAQRKARFVHRGVLYDRQSEGRIKQLEGQ